MTNNRWFALYPLAALLLLLTTVAFADGRNKELYVVPTPGAVTIDGSLDDWDLSGMVVNIVVPETAETMSARLAMMYDADALYIGGIVRDTSPMMNRHDPQTSPDKAWDADVCQIFFSLDPDETLPLKYNQFAAGHRDVSPVGTMLLWYYTDRAEPSIAMYRGMGFSKPLRPDLSESGLIPNAHFTGAYKKAADGMSYSFEYRIPWATFPMKRKPVATDNLAAAMAVFWGRPDGLKTAGGHAWSWNVMSQPGFAFQASNCWGTLIFTPEGHIPREWVDGPQAPEKPLPLTFSYTLPRAGEVTIQLFDENNRSVRILVPQQQRSEGVNTERWDGLDDQGNPLPPGRYTMRGLVHDPVKAAYRFSAHNSGNPPYPTEDNRGGWGGDHGTPQAALALADGMILSWNVCEYGWGIIRTDLDGKKLWGSKYNAEHLATDGKRLFVAGGHSFAETGGVCVLDLADSRPINFQPGMPALLPPDGGTKETNAVTGLACDGQQIYVTYGQRNLLVSYDLNGNVTAQCPVPAPGRIALRPDGSLAVISNNQVVSVKGGNIFRLIAGPLDSPRSIAVSPKGDIFVALAGKTQQVWVFTAKGKKTRTIGKAGGRPAMGHYNPSGMFQPGGIAYDARGRLWVAETTDGPKRISVWDTKSGKNVREFFGSSGYFASGALDPTRPDELYTHYTLWKIDWKNYKATPFSTVWRPNPGMVGAPAGDGYAGYAQMVTGTDGRQYMWGGRGNDEALLQRQQGDTFKPFLRISGGKLWQDRNNDQQVQPDEEVALQVGRVPLTYSYLAVVAKDLSLRLTSGHRLPVNHFANGLPVYDPADLQAFPVKVGGGYIYEDDGGNVYTYAQAKNGVFSKYSPDGRLLWQYTGIVRWHDALGMPITGPGRLWSMTGPMGVAGDYLIHMTYLGVNHIFTTDGVYVGALLKDGRLGEAGADTSQPEGQLGTFVKLNLDGKERYFMIHGGQDTRVWEILGLDSVQRLPDSIYTHTEEAATTARTALEAWQAAMTKHNSLVIVPGRAALDGATPVSKAIDDNRRVEARIAYDNANLYVRYDITSPTDLVNATPEDQLIFRGGNCLDLQIATDPKADAARTKPAAGDLRVLVTRKNGQPFAMIYRPKIAGFTGEPIKFNSPTGGELFDKIEQSDRITLDYTKTDSGFTAVVTVPLSVIGWQPRAGETVRMDVGYVFGNAQGTRAAARAYWSNNSFTANVVNDIPHESRLEPAEWGNATVE